MTPPPNPSAPFQAVLEKVHREGISVLSLSELQLLQQHHVGLASHDTSGVVLTPGGVASAAPASWQEERRSLLAALNSLKDLLAQLQGNKDISKVSVMMSL